jgi:hypothetical protein
MASCSRDLAEYLAHKSYLPPTCEMLAPTFQKLDSFDVQSNISLAFPLRALTWKRLGQPLWAKAHRALSARLEIMRSDTVKEGMAGSNTVELLSRLKPGERV